VSTFWPKFGRHGKENITVRDVLDHKAGLITFGREFCVDEAKNSELISKLIEEAEPLWTPGTKRGYHALSYGFLVDEMLKRLHPEKHSISEIYEEEIWRQGITFHIGRRPTTSQHSLAVITNAPAWKSILSYLRRPLRFAHLVWNHYKYDVDLKSANYPYFLAIMRRDIMPYNDASVTELPLVSVMGVGTAEGFARAVHEVFKKGLISDKIWNLIRSPTGADEDIVLSNHKPYGHGFSYAPHPVHKKEWTIRFIGNGLQVVEVDRRDEIIIVMLRNGLRAGDDGEQEYERIAETVIKLAQ
ncbi:unnamed protein product, partial [Cylicostephanus goldi]